MVADVTGSASGDLDSRLYLLEAAVVCVHGIAVVAGEDHPCEERKDVVRRADAVAGAERKMLGVERRQGLDAREDVGVLPYAVSRGRDEHAGNVLHELVARAELAGD